MGLCLIAFHMFWGKKNIIGVIIALIAFCVHSSAILVIISFFITRIVKKNYYYFIFWVVCLIVVLLLGNQLELLVNSSLHYIGSHDSRYYATSKSFRFDFLLYSLPPILISFYYLIVKQKKDVFYNQLASIYLFCNAFWLIMSHNWLSDRYAYLSWFIYTFLIFYPFSLVSKINF